MGGALPVHISTASSNYFHALTEPKRTADQFDNVGMVGQTVEERSRHPFITKGLNPIREFQVGGHNQSQTLVEFRTEGKQDLRSIGRKRDKPKFIQDDQIQFESSPNPRCSRCSS